MKSQKSKQLIFWVLLIGVFFIGICLVWNTYIFTSEGFNEISPTSQNKRLYVEKSWINSEGKDKEYLHVFNDSFTVVDNIQNADVSLQDVHAPFLNFPRKVMYAFEPNYVTPEWWSTCKVVLVSHKHLTSNESCVVIYYPFGFFYINAHNYVNDVLHRNKRIFAMSPQDLTQRKFCIFINSNFAAKERIEFCKKLMKYKHVDCPGAVLNNCPRVEPAYFTTEFRNHLRQYKFMICFENSDFAGYFTEKPMNAYLGDTIPIYWCNGESQKYFNENSMVLLKEFNERTMDEAINRIIELDNNDNLYIQTLQQPLLNENKFPEEFSIQSIQTQISRALMDS